MGDSYREETKRNEIKLSFTVLVGSEAQAEAEDTGLIPELSTPSIPAKMDKVSRDIKKSNKNSVYTLFYTAVSVEKLSQRK